MLYTSLEDNKNYWTGKKIISINNDFQSNSENSSIEIGTITDIVPITKSKTPVPVVKFEDGGERLCFSTIIEYNERLWNSLNKLTAEERWEILTAFICRF